MYHEGVLWYWCAEMEFWKYSHWPVKDLDLGLDLWGFCWICWIHCGISVIVVADIPGLIKGAHQNRGLGMAFLRHVERCRFLLYVVDLSVSQPWLQLQDLKYELEQYKKGLSERPCVVIGNKIDLAQSRINLPLLKEQIDERVIALSALRGDNLEELFLHLRELYDTYVKTEQSRGQSPVKW